MPPECLQFGLLTLNMAGFFHGSVVWKSPDDLSLRHLELAGQEYGHLIGVLPDGRSDSFSCGHEAILASEPTLNLYGSRSIYDLPYHPGPITLPT